MPDNLDQFMIIYDLNDFGMKNVSFDHGKAIINISTVSKHKC